MGAGDFRWAERERFREGYSFEKGFFDLELGRRWCCKDSEYFFYRDRRGK